jgi:hypothetical protein
MTLAWYDIVPLSARIWYALVPYASGFFLKLKTAEKSDSTHPGRQNESTPERGLEAASTLLCEHGFSDVGIGVYLASPSRNDPALPEISEDLQKHGVCLDILVETKPAGF